MPVVEEELLLTNTQQACHQGIQSLGREIDQFQLGKKAKASIVSTFCNSASEKPVHTTDRPRATVVSQAETEAQLF